MGYAQRQPCYSTYLAVRGFDKGPPFQTEDRKPLMRLVLVKECASSIAPGRSLSLVIHGHSFKIREATTPQLQILMVEELTAMYIRYVRTSQLQLVSLSKQLAT